MELMRVENAVVSFEGVPAVNGVSFSVEQDDYLVILGENGSGKSTLMRAMLGLVKLKSGAITYAGGLRKNRIGYLPQQTRVQRDFPASVEEVVYSGLAGRMKWPFFLTKTEKAEAVRHMEQLEIADMGKRPYRTLSGGQQQRVLLARALCAAEGILLLDEPVTGLDPAVTEELYSVIRDLNAKGMAVVTVSHDVRGALTDAKHVLVMDDARAAFFGTSEDYRIWRRENGG